jgi:Sulfotransferase family
MLILLAPPRSFSSVVCAMIGQHPELYGFPELLLFTTETVAQLRQSYVGRMEWGPLLAVYPPGLLRALAELDHGEQSAAAVEAAQTWLEARRDWPTRRVFDHLLQRVHPRRGVEKSPPTVAQTESLQRVLAACPTAKFLHLTRHPITALASMQEHFAPLARPVPPEWSEHFLPDLTDPRMAAWTWVRLHGNILEFTRALPPGQSMRIKGEELLSDPDTHLTRIAAWLGVRTDPAAIEAMKHPERSPYATRGPKKAPGGYDPKFLESPGLRRPRDPPPTLQPPEAWEIMPWLWERVLQRASELGYP